MKKLCEVCGEVARYSVSDMVRKEQDGWVVYRTVGRVRYYCAKHNQDSRVFDERLGVWEEYDHEDYRDSLVSGIVPTAESIERFCDILERFEETWEYDLVIE